MDFHEPMDFGELKPSD